MSLRVDFRLSEYALSSGAVIRAAREAFGERVARYANRAGGMKITCTSDQMIKFLVLRNRYGGNNGWRELDVELFEAAPPRAVELYVDVRF